MATDKARAVLDLSVERARDLIETGDEQPDVTGAPPPTNPNLN